MTQPGPHRPARPIRKALLALATIAMFGAAMHVLAPAANGIKIAGLPLGYEIAAQIGPLILALLVIFMSRSKVRS